MKIADAVWYQGAEAIPGDAPRAAIVVGIIDGDHVNIAHFDINGLLYIAHEVLIYHGAPAFIPADDYVCLPGTKWRVPLPVPKAVPIAPSVTRVTLS